MLVLLHIHGSSPFSLSSSCLSLMNLGPFRQAATTLATLSSQTMISLQPTSGIMAEWKEKNLQG
eukprot:m.125558 g.125558  ORF g.125558 m.125558 type:complete len:64 (+) comp23470_c1_seq4:6224-6415(+)